MATKQCKSTLAVFGSWDDVFVFCVAYLELEYLTIKVLLFAFSVIFCTSLRDFTLLLVAIHIDIISDKRQLNCLQYR